MVLLAFILQVIAAALAFALAPRIARGGKGVWVGACVGALVVLLAWPLMRVFPIACVDALGAPFLACVELTGLAIPAVLLFGVAAPHLPKRSDQRALRLLTAIAGLYFVKAGWWMILPGGGVPALGVTNMDRNGLCRQTTGYTCVAASMVTMLRAKGITADETEMARLSYTQVGGGATDSRALWALQRKLEGTGFVPRYRALDREGLIEASKPCMVQLDWGYFVSHMVPVMEADAETVVIGDPLSGERRVPMSEFEAQWKGKAITIDAK